MAFQCDVDPLARVGDHIEEFSDRISEFQPCPLGEPAYNGLGLQEQFSIEIWRVKDAHEAKRRIQGSGTPPLIR